MVQHHPTISSHPNNQWVYSDQQRQANCFPICNRIPDDQFLLQPSEILFLGLYYTLTWIKRVFPSVRPLSLYPISAYGGHRGGPCLESHSISQNRKSMPRTTPSDRVLCYISITWPCHTTFSLGPVIPNRYTPIQANDTWLQYWEPRNQQLNS